jgi:ParB family chromosome partitioning protein
MNAHTDIAMADAANGAVINIPLNKLKKSSKNARKVPHTEAAIEALAASIAAKGVLQAPVVEPELGEDGQPTGFFLVTIGEGRRLALRLRAKRRQIKKGEPVRCVVDLANDPEEISLDENVTRSEMHPADQFEAFRDLAERKGWGAEEIGARFGVSAQVVRQRLRLGAVSPKLMDIYRQDGLTLDQLMAFAVSEDHDRQEQVYEQLSWNKAPHLIRRMMTETKVAADDRRAVFVGAEAYAEAGGSILRDLFTEDDGGWFEDVALLDRLVAEKLAALAAGLRDREGWKWAQAHLDYPHSHGFAQVYPHRVEQSPERLAEIATLAETYDAFPIGRIQTPSSANRRLKSAASTGLANSTTPIAPMTRTSTTPTPARQGASPSVRPFAMRLTSARHSPSSNRSSEALAAAQARGLPI